MKLPRISAKQLIGRDVPALNPKYLRDKAGPAGMYLNILGKELGSAVEKRRPGHDSEASSPRQVLPSPSALPAIDHRIRLGSADNQKFCEVVGASATDHAHGGYLHAVTFPLSTELMTKKSFPLRLLGLIHLKNSVVHHRAVAVDSTVKIRVQVKGFGKHRRGTTVTILAEIWDESGELAFTDESVYLSKEAPASNNRKNGTSTSDISEGREQRPDPRDGFTLIGMWRLPSATGRSYAKASGDANPIHLSNATAKIFGMKSAIAHGMYCASRALTQATRDPAAPCSWSVEFGSPVFLPTKVGIWRDLDHGTRSEVVLRGIGQKNRKNFDFSWRGPAAHPDQD